jgi:5'-nucleotidase
MQDVIIPNQQKLDEKIQAIKQAGSESMHILSDFDQTLIKAFVNGKLVQSLTVTLRDHSLLLPSYSEKARALTQLYYPIETDPAVPLNEKKLAMHKWWTEIYALMIDSGLTHQHLTQVIELTRARLRTGASKFFSLLHQHGVPLIIMSATGIGAEAIRMFLDKNRVMLPNVHIIGNNFIWDEQGKAVGVIQPIIHSLNKDETAIQNFPAYKEVKNRRNVILLGDFIDDIGMVEGFDYANLITVGFLNENADEQLPAFREHFDVIITNDGPMDQINSMLTGILE